MRPRGPSRRRVRARAAVLTSCLVLGVLLAVEWPAAILLVPLGFIVALADTVLDP